MGAPVGNQFYKLRTKHGRDKIFSDPKILLEEAEKHFQWCIDNPLKEAQIVKGPIKTKDENGQEITLPYTIVEIPVMRAFTWQGLELFLGIHSLRDYKTNEKYKDFSQVITHIEKIIYTQKFTGAAGNLLNPNIIARDLGLADKKELQGEVNIKNIEVDID